LVGTELAAFPHADEKLLERIGFNLSTNSIIEMY
jgi:hypothetical protein